MSPQSLPYKFTALLISICACSAVALAQTTSKGRQELRHRGVDKIISTPKCTSAELRKKREEAKALYGLKKFTEGVNLLSEFIDKNDCFGALAFHKNSEDLSEIQKAGRDEYLWALSDVIFGNLSAGKYAECLASARTQLEQYGNLLGESKNKKLMSAFLANAKQCEEKRFSNLKKIELPPCADKLTKREISVLEENRTIKKELRKITQSFEIPGSKDCIALAEIEIPNDYYDSVNPDSSSQPNFQAPVLVYMPDPAKHLALQVLPDINSGVSDFGEYWCGVGVLSAWKTTVKSGEQTDPFYFRLKGSLSYCHGGSAEMQYDALYRFIDGKVVRTDDASYGRH